MVGKSLLIIREFISSGICATIHSEIKSSSSFQMHMVATFSGHGLRWCKLFWTLQYEVWSLFIGRYY